MQPARLSLRCSVRRVLLLATLLVANVMLSQPAFGQEAHQGSEPLDISSSWLEPQGIGIVDLVGVVPEQYLKGAILRFTPSMGIVTYQSGTRSGDVVTIRAHASPRQIVTSTWNGSFFGCITQPAWGDQLGTASPAMTVRVYQGTREVTGEVDSMRYIPSGKVKPSLNPKESQNTGLFRYWETALISPPPRTSDGQISIPGNMGCEMIIPYKNYLDLDLVVKVRSPQVISAKVMGQETFTFRSYLGPGSAGHLQSLVNQLYGAGYGQRHDKFTLHVPAGSDYFFVNFPTMSADAYTNYPGNPLGNVDRPSGGTYRTVIDPGLSVDHVASMALPLASHWQDIDQADGTWLRYDEHARQIAAPEYFIAPGVPYDPCMTRGGCSADILSRAYNTTATMTVAYLAVSRISANLERLPVQMVGSGYHAQVAESLPAIDLAAGADPSSPAPAAESPAAGGTGRRVFLPSVRLEQPPIPPDDPSGCSPNGGCGWFTPDGRMVDYIPYP